MLLPGLAHSPQPCSCKCSVGGRSHPKRSEPANRGLSFPIWTMALPSLGAEFAVEASSCQIQEGA